MIYLASNIVKDVRVALDNNMSGEALAVLGDVDTLSLDEIVRSKIVEGVKRVHSQAPVYLLDEGHNFGDAVYWADKESGWVLLPDDFMRLVVYKMSDWERPVYEAITPNSPIYALQSSRFKGLRGTSQKPVCAISIRPEGRALEFYSCKSENATVERGVYLPYPKIENGGVEICSKCYDAVIYSIAALTLSTYKEAEAAAAFLELSKSALL